LNNFFCIKIFEKFENQFARETFKYRTKIFIGEIQMTYSYLDNIDKNLTLFRTCLQSFSWTIIDTFFHVFEIKYSYAMKIFVLKSQEVASLILYSFGDLKTMDNRWGMLHTIFYCFFSFRIE
jgi:hypothetical protein